MAAKQWLVRALFCQSLAQCLGAGLSSPTNAAGGPAGKGARTVGQSLQEISLEPKPRWPDAVRRHSGSLGSNAPVPLTCPWTTTAASESCMGQTMVAVELSIVSATAQRSRRKLVVL
ncbi:hypothetical protein MYCTH_2112126 [Thermothelomyces thermophilus ATCC 42464]|uniref:Uncharacterized protein n=1 Tax=Thermothelomyces thermophilus (strain ATCC 42464 / BCRC 31852 / DSM 1799) TaxID=573729 RepID=G2QK93_THET4|nr:uncharacterized protein MYCTH_2112126 [Thermothelomyces thermophilus ATCC 42464]AEO59999.1 hypothetical protein MYCTH_2112126 [Thermothelomyces thermophilus ATCC 42464]